jgi:hypothetical protein
MTERLNWAINQRRMTAADLEDSDAARAGVDQSLSLSSTAEGRQDRVGRVAANAPCYWDHCCANQPLPHDLWISTGAAMLCLRTGESEIELAASDGALHSHGSGG